MAFWLLASQNHFNPVKQRIWTNVGFDFECFSFKAKGLILGSRRADVQRSKNQPLGWRKAFKSLLLWGNFLSYCGPGHKEMESLSEVGHVRKQDVSLLLPDCFCKILQQIWRLILGLIAWIKQDLKQNKAGLFQCFLPLLHPISLYTTLSLAFSVGLSDVTFQTCHIGWAIEFWQILWFLRGLPCSIEINHLFPFFSVRLFSLKKHLVGAY